MQEVSDPSIPYNFKELLQHSPVAFYTCDKDGYLTYFNQAAVDLWGRTPELGKDLWCGSWKIYDTDLKPIPLNDYPTALVVSNRSSSNGVEIIIERPDHTFSNILVFPHTIINDQDVLVGAHNTLVDISFQKKGGEKDSILSAIVESSDDAIISKTLDGIITSWNNGAEKIFEYKEDEIIGKAINILIPQHLQDEEKVIINSIKAGKKIDHFRTVRLSKSGKEIHVSITVSPVKNKMGNIVGASKIARNISEQIHRENTLKQTAQRLEILNSIGKTISEKLEVQSILQKVTDYTTIITGAAFGAFYYNAINKQGEVFTLNTLSGITKEEFEQFEVFGNTAIFNSVFSGEGIVRLDDITKDPRYNADNTNKETAKESLQVVSCLAVPLITNNGTVIGGLIFGHSKPGVFKEEHEDILNSIASQAAVALDNSKLYEEVKLLNNKKDEFIALASHELKTPLTTIKGYIQLFQMKSTDELCKFFADKALSQAERLNLLITDLFDISKIESGRLQLSYESFDTVKLITDIIDTFQYSSPTHHFIFDDHKKEIIVEADKQRIEQVIINLLTNAVKYSEEASKIYITTGVLDNKVYIKVKDEGVGINKEQLSQVFTKFYRGMDNPNMPGLGLGLYLAKEIVTHHNGNINAISETGEGSEFIVTLPIAKNADN